MNNNLRLVINNSNKKIEEKNFFEKKRITDYLRSICKNGF